jgi:phenylacetic acid degradation protein
MNAVVMDRAHVGAGCVVGALTFVPADMQIPERKVVVGNPARIVKDVSDEMLAWKTEGTTLYQRLPARLHETLRVCDPLRGLTEEQEGARAAQRAVYRTWNETRAKRS